ncbi:MAG: hypothetical protein GY839_16065 [candidate division Zixibacteria bacterium]|nr:hypothetical protein [candidate division Zixibacteria bacterium]
MNKLSNRLLIVSLVIAASLLLTGIAQAEQCFSIIVGKDASANGYVMLGHNEDNGAPLAVNHRKMPRQNYSDGDIIKLDNSGQLKQVEQTWEYIWAEIPGAIFSDGYVNEWGVSVASDKCLSKEDSPELTDGGISFMFRQIIAQRARSARDGIRIAAELIERFGYDASGRTYMICDPDEGWMFCAIYGKNWLARRVSDDEVAVIANSYTVRAVDLADTNHFIASDGIIEYAQKRGWYNPETDGDFDFAKAFADQEVAEASYNLYRQWGGLRYLTDEKVELNNDMPFSIKPDHKLEVFDIINILRDHYEGTEAHDLLENATNPHENKYHTICNDDTYNSFVVELRKDMPAEIGIVYWMCLGNPCNSFYIPFHFGIDQFPEAYLTSLETPTEARYHEMISRDFTTPKSAFWRYIHFGQKIRATYAGNHERLNSIRDDFENRLLIAKTNAEKKALGIYNSEKNQANFELEKFFSDQYLESYKKMVAILSLE